MVVWEVCPALVSPKSIVPPVLRDTTPGLAQSGVVFVVPPPPGRVPLDTTSRLEPDSGFPCLAMRRDSFKACFAFLQFASACSLRQIILVYQHDMLMS